MPGVSGSSVPESHFELLTSTALAHVATLGPDGQPQSTPVWFDWDGSRLRIGLASDRQKLRNLRRDPRLAVSIANPAIPGHYIELRGTATFEEEDPDRTVLARMVARYTGSADLSWVTGARTIIALEPTHVTFQ